MFVKLLVEHRSALLLPIHLLHNSITSNVGRTPPARDAFWIMAGIAHDYIKINTMGNYDLSFRFCAWPRFVGSFSTSAWVGSLQTHFFF